MSCPRSDLKDYFFGELPAAERAAVDTHLASCDTCRDELAALDLTRVALLSVPDEEPPRRIAFVSDKVFEPRWWQRLWASGPQLGFAAAAMLTLAIFAHGLLTRPAPVAAPPQPTAAVTVPHDVIAAEVAKAVAASEEKQFARTLELVNAKLQDTNTQRREDLLMIRDYLERLEKKRNTSLSRVMYDQ